MSYTDGRLRDGLRTVDDSNSQKVVGFADRDGHRCSVQPGCRSRLYQYVRPRGRKFQARVWLGHEQGGHLNLGLYEEERAAHEAVKRYLRTGEVPAKVMPRFVRVAAGGAGYRARVKLRGRVFTVAPCPTPDLAHRKILRLLKAAFGDSIYPPRDRVYARR